MRLLDRYILRLIVLPLLVGVGLFVVILMSEAALKLGEAVVGAHVPVGSILRYLFFSLPRALSWSLPVGVLFGVAMTCTNLSRTGEFVAMRVGGASPQRIWAVFLLVGVIGSAASFAVEEFVVPASNERATDAFKDMTQRQPILRSRDQQTFRDRDGRIFYVGHMDDLNNRMQDLMVLEEDASGLLKTLTVARWAEVQGERWVLHDGVKYSLGATGEPAGSVRFTALEVRLWTALQDYYLDQRSPFEMSTREMRDSIAALKGAGLDTQSMEVRVQFKYSVPLACMVFVLVAAPLALRYAHMGSFAGILLSIVVVFLYNGLRSWGLAFGLVGDLPPIAAAWAQNVAFGLVGLVMYVRAR